MMNANFAENRLCQLHGGIIYSGRMPHLGHVPGENMRRLRLIAPRLPIAGLILLTLVSGRTVPGCICADGHFEWFCPETAENTGAHQCCGLKNRDGESGCCGAGTEVTAARCKSRVPTHGCCHFLATVPMLATDTSPAIKHHDTSADWDFALRPLAAVETAPSFSLRDASPGLHWANRDRLSLFQTLLL